MIRKLFASLGHILHDLLFGYMYRNGLILCTASLPNGSTLSLSTTYGAVKTFASITNANPAIATFLTGHGLLEGDIVEVSSGWGKLDGRAVKIGEADDSPPLLIPFLGINSSDTDDYPAGAGGGSIREITAFTQITQILGFATTGGDPRFTTFQFLEELRQRQLVAGSNAQSLEIQIADDISLAGYLALKEASEANDLRVLKLALVNGSVILYNGKVFLNETPTVTNDEVMAVTATFTLEGAPVRY